MRRWLVTVEEEQSADVAPIAGIYVEAPNGADAVIQVRKILENATLIPWPRR